MKIRPSLLILALTLLVLLFWFFSYRLLEVPTGLTADEGAFGLNAVLLSQTGRDENGRFMPVFVLSLNGVDWRQPVTQYYHTLFFKLFGPSVFNLRFSSVVITLFSAGLIYFLAQKLLDTKLALAALLIFLTTPLIMIQSHLGLDNIMPVPFTLLWLIFLYLYSKSNRKLYLILAGFSLGIAFYSYKGMRATVPVWSLLTVFYLLKPHFRQGMSKSFWFALGISPFFLVMPLLDQKYPGAVFDRHGWASMSVYQFIEPYIGSYDPSFLFITGDITPWHSTGLHGMFLLASFPLFVIGLIQAFKKRNFWWLVLAAFFTAPLLYGFVGSIHRASRLMSIIPPFSLIAALGAHQLWQRKKIILLPILFIAILNYADFTHHYWYKYPELSRQWFGDLSYYSDYQLLGQKSKELGLTPYIDDRLESEGHSGRYFEAAYVGQTTHINNSITPPPGSIYLTVREEIPGMAKLDLPTQKYHILVHNP